MSLVEVSRALSRAVAPLRFAAPVRYVYNPLEYARAPHELYVRRFARKGIDALLLGMNPGPFGMAQTGVPFGEVELVRDWLGIEGEVLRPRDECPERKVLGFACPRSEVSGKRLWGWARQRFETPEREHDGEHSHDPEHTVSHSSLLDGSKPVPHTLRSATSNQECDSVSLLRRERQTVHAQERQLVPLAGLELDERAPHAEEAASAQSEGVPPLEDRPLAVLEQVLDDADHSCAREFSREHGPNGGLALDRRLGHLVIHR